MREAPQEKFNNSDSLVDREKEVHLLQGLDHVLDRVAQLGEGDPLLALSLASRSSMASARPHWGGDPRWGCYCPCLHQKPGTVASHFRAPRQHLHAPCGVSSERAPGVPLLGNYHVTPPRCPSLHKSWGRRSGLGGD